MPGLVLLGGAIVALGLSLVDTRRLMGFPVRFLLAGLPTGAVVLTTVYVFGEDSYVGTDTSRWTRYSGGAHPLYAGAIAVALLATLTLLTGALRVRRGILRAGLVLSSLGCVACLIAVIGFSVN